MDVGTSGKTRANKHTKSTGRFNSVPRRDRRNFALEILLQIIGNQLTAKKDLRRKVGESNENKFADPGNTDEAISKPVARIISGPVYKLLQASMNRGEIIKIRAVQ